jgi:hypothetical protein
MCFPIELYQLSSCAPQQRGSEHLKFKLSGWLGLEQCTKQNMNRAYNLNQPLKSFWTWAKEQFPGSYTQARQKFTMCQPSIMSTSARSCHDKWASLLCMCQELAWKVCSADDRSWRNSVWLERWEGMLVDMWMLEEVVVSGCHPCIIMLSVEATRKDLFVWGCVVCHCCPVLSY